MNAPPPRYDIYCRVVDNYGDIGVCWRLARQLSSHGLARRVCLHVDDLSAFARIAPGVNPSLAWQRRQGVDIAAWQDAPPPEPPDVVIEAFACTPPPAVVATMPASTIWLNLEYLATEPWAADCHGLPSPQPAGQRKFFFIPGFTEPTGGLIREARLLEARRAWQAAPSMRDALLTRLGAPPDTLARLRRGARLLFVFCYADAPVPTLLSWLRTRRKAAVVLLAAGTQSALPDPVDDDLVQVLRLPYVPQHDFDRLLWSADLNFVRGEDSLVRAIWASRPLVWQPYRQDAGAHLDKLDAWLSLAALPPAVQALHRSWNRPGADDLTMALDQAGRAPVWPQWQAAQRAWSSQLASQDDLATRLSRFVHEQAATHPLSLRPPPVHGQAVQSR